ncbi:hypothetical protein DEU56DRAFT_353868 [Suillus clintonianus]|uniref:uncharacterized protein n=1 Tax=Suillus clintonianus TaxID=1904413 RepID=UPI001B8763CB|nr:uncharacterized protein DEU56DRAFT_353868 [Suillus clintonianus]KAG2137034.1 hypothetical protein DEU56DRAFT_353868 [Suillus clintonianus]
MMWVNAVFLPLERRIQMDYSAADIEAAMNLQLSMHLYTALATFWTYDYACSLEQEWIFLFRSRWTKVKGLYIVTRHVPFFLIMDLLVFTSNDSPDKCRVLSSIYSCFALISLTCSECFFVLRTYSLLNRNKIILTAMMTSLFATTASTVAIFFTTIPTSYVTTSAIPGITGCYRSSNTVEVLLPFLLMFAFQLGLICLTLTCVIRTWRSTRSPLYAILAKHNIFYYATGLLFSIVNILMPLLALDSAYLTVLEDLQVFILAILATRMHLYLWRIDRRSPYHTCDTDHRDTNRAF